MPVEDRLRRGLAREASSAGVERALETVWRRRRTTVRRRAIGGVALVASLAALTPWAVREVTGHPEPEPARPDQLVGTFAVRLTDPTDPQMAGRWLVRLDDLGGLTVDAPDGFTAELHNPSAYEIVDGQLRTNVFVYLPGCQLPEAITGQYTWHPSGSGVVFSEVEDGCEPRSALFAAPWRRVR